MDTNKEHRESREEKNQKNKNQEQDEKIIAGDSDKAKELNAERLQDSEHRMDQRDNDVQNSVSYDQHTRKDVTDADDDLEMQWKGIESDYRKQYPKITDEDVKYNSGNFDNMPDRIAKRTNRTREEVRMEIRDWKNR